MGVHNRQRRQQKKAKRDRQRRSEASAGRARQDAGSITWDLGVVTMVRKAAVAVSCRRDEAPELLELLVAGPPVTGGQRAVARELDETLADAVLAMASSHWYPSEIVRQVRRRGGAAAEQVAVSAVLKAWRRGGAGVLRPEWAAEAALLEPSSWRLDPAEPTWPVDVEAAVGVLGLLAHLPPLPECRSGDRADDRAAGAAERGRLLEKVRHLLSKAESTEFAAEAEAFTAKAQELLARYSIDRAALDMADAARRHSGVAVRRVWIDDPYVTAKAQLLHVVASANRCRSVLIESLGLATVAGHEDDLDTVETLFTSLLTQATAQMTAAGSKKDSAGRTRTRSFRRSFLVAFAIRIGQRLRSAGEATISEATATHGNALVPVLASREQAADEAITELFPELVHHDWQVTDGEGWAAGTRAADLASLSAQSELVDQVA